MEFAAVAGAQKPLVLGKGPVPEPTARGIRVKTVYAGICHTDINFIRDETDLGGGQKMLRSEALAQFGQKFQGTVLGHEVSGIVDALGADVDPTSNIKVGDRVLVYPWLGCQNCTECQQGYNNLCSINQGGAMDLGLGPNSGGYGSYVLVPDVKFAIKVPDNIGLDIACTLPCSAITAYWAVKKAQPFIQQSFDMRSSARVLVNGAGGLGLWAISFLAAIYKDRSNVEIYASDIGEDKLELARKKGATHTVLLQKGATPDCNASLLLGEDNKKFCVVLDFVGAEATVNMSMKVLDKWSALAVVGMGGGQLAFPLVRMTYNTFSVYGTRTGPINIMPEILEIVGKEDFPVPSLEFFSLAQVNEALDKLRQGKISGRAVIKYAE